MKLRIAIDVDVSPTVRKTIERVGFTLAKDGSGFQVQVGNSPSVPKRKTNVRFIENPIVELDEIDEIQGMHSLSPDSEE